MLLLSGLWDGQTVNKVNHLRICGDQFGIMGADQNACGVRALDTFQQGDDVARGLTVKVGRGFIRDDQRGLGDQGAGNGHALTLATENFRRGAGPPDPPGPPHPDIPAPWPCGHWPASGGS